MLMEQKKWVNFSLLITMMYKYMNYKSYKKIALSISTSLNLFLDNPEEYFSPQQISPQTKDLQNGKEKFGNNIIYFTFIVF